MYYQGISLEIYNDGKKEGIQSGMQQGQINAFIKMIKKGLITIRDAAKELNMKEKDLSKLLIA